ncbi:unnamed protein product [Miscanthus lutarioriparius]|uniref:Uncharacterized protein n=1 Tax=Miscanthus lutarioriparius TaxID=422564 RepID=A0A811P9I8_9POAL|nr:unnamed protein product [Miscanthus lutarioriparius]
MAGSATDPGAGGGHGWDLGRRGKGVERWGNFGVLRRGGGGLVAGEGEGSRWRGGEEARGHSPSERASCTAGAALQGRWIARSARLERRIGRFELPQPSNLGPFLWLVSFFRSGKAYGYELHDGDWIMGNQL